MKHCNQLYKTYIQQVIHNAAAFSDAFKEKGYDVLSGGTDNHLVLLNLHSKGITGKDAENALIKADITVNKKIWYLLIPKNLPLPQVLESAHLQLLHEALMKMIAVKSLVLLMKC